MYKTAWHKRKKENIMAFEEIIVYTQDDTVCFKVNPEYAFAGCEF